MRLEISESARADIFDLQDQGMRNFGLHQTERFLDSLVDTLDTLAFMPGIGREFTEFDPPIRVHRYKSLVIVYQISEDVVRVSRVLHARRNWREHV